MLLDKITKIEEEVRQLHINPVQTSHSFSRLDAQTTFSDFWTFHVKPVIEISKRLAEKYNSAMPNVVWLAAILHDIARLTDQEPHDEIGAEKARVFLEERGFWGNDVESIILTHRCKKHVPQTLEQKIIATADAMAHFQQPFYLWYSYMSNKSFSQQLRTMLPKLERDYHTKIFFNKEREAVRNQYEVLKSWFNV